MVDRMRAALVSAALFGVSLCGTQAAWGQVDPAEPVRAALKSFAQAFNKHDAAAVAAAWTEDAVYTDPAGGAELIGRAQIQEWYAQLFKDCPQAALKAEIMDTEFAGDAKIFVRGTAEVTGGEGEPERSSFVAALVKQGDRWLVASVEESGPDPLADLNWLVGDWKDDREGPPIDSTFAWEGNSRFLVRKYTITDEDGSLRTGTQYIAGNAATGQLRSWVFDSEGAVAEGDWAAKDDHWAIHWHATLPDGRHASATQVLKPIDEDAFEVKWSDVDVDGHMRPSTDPVTVRRVAAAAATTGNKP
jgi:uncharacterized protein (TIGR02246 family)